VPNSRLRLAIAIGSVSAVAGLGLLVGARFPEIIAVPDGVIDVIYGGAYDKGIVLTAENRSNRTIYFRNDGSNTILPGFARTECRSALYEGGEIDLPVIAEAYASYIKLSPGSRVRFNIETNIPSKYPGGHCHTRIQVLGGLFVETREYTPR